MAHPYSGRIGRSPGAVPTIKRMLSSISRSWDTRAIDPVASSRIGKPQPAPMNSSLIAPSSIQLHLRTLDLDRAAAVDLDARVTLERQGPAGFEIHVALRLDQHLALALDVDLGVAFVERHLDLGVAGDQGDPGLTRVLKEHELVSLAGHEPVAFHLALVEKPVAEVRLVLAVVEAADDERPADVAVLEGNKHLVAHLGDEDRARVGTGAELSDPRPVRLVVVRQPGKLDFDAPELVLVVVLGHDAHDHPVDRPATRHFPPPRQGRAAS